MAKLVSDAMWDKFRDIMRDAHDTFMQDSIIWVKTTEINTEWGEDDKLTKTNITLKCLFNYNYFRQWGTTDPGPEGELDEQTTLMLLNKQYLSELGYLANNRFNYNPDDDRFILDGVKYKAMGDSHLSQANDDPIHFFVILKRENLATGTDLHEDA